MYKEGKWCYPNSGVPLRGLWRHSGGGQMRSATVWLLGLFVLALVAPTTEAADLPPAPRFEPRIVNGTLTPAYPSVGILLFGIDSDSASLECSGTLIGCQTFLTAGHCVEYDRNPADYFVFLPNAGFFAVASIALHPTYSFPVGDVAVLKLTVPVTGIVPSRINETATPTADLAGTIVGFGRTGGGYVNADYGLKRSGEILTATCGNGISDVASTCWKFTNPLGPPGTNSSTCNGDSGGPLFIDFGAGDTVAGVTSGGRKASCLPTDQSFDANVFTYRDWIDTQGGADLANQRCGSGAQVGEEGTRVVAESGSLSSSGPGAVHSFDVPAGTTDLRVALNAVDDGFSDFDLYVRQGSAPSTSTYDCRAFGSNPYGFCDFSTPAPGVWYVLVDGYAGAGPYQVTATLFGIDCADPANAGQACDDGNACTGNDVCQAGACQGAAVADGSPCDDGNECTQSDSCQAGGCSGQAVADGTPCDDHDACSRPDSCQAGTCTGNAPALGCKQSIVANAGRLALRQGRVPVRDSMNWVWGRGAETSGGDLGDPLATTDYTLCLYDETAGQAQRIMKHAMPAGSGWKMTRSGFRYRDPKLTAGGVNRVRLVAGLAGKARVVVHGRARPLLLPSLPLQQQSTVTIQLLNDNVCWESRFSTAVKNRSDLFRARSD